jgi:3-hydroxyanthranilate 3,4-dioxygenase
MPIRPPFPLAEWIESNRHLLQPPVGAKRVYEDAETIVMVVGGPNTRKDYHIDPGEELFYQIEGDMLLKVVDDGEFRDIPIREGEMFLLPAFVPHSPQRFAGTVGLVIERQRGDAPEEDDAARWYCESCGAVLHEARFNNNRGGFLPQLQAAIQAFHASEALRTCGQCGAVQPVPGAVSPEDA